MKNNLKQLSRLEKISFFVTITLSLLVIVMSTLSLFDVITYKLSSFFIYPSMTIVITLNGIKVLKQNKPAAIFSFACSAFILIVSIIMFVGYLK